jgi:2-keto-myo-inositol isomerase
MSPDRIAINSISTRQDSIEQMLADYAVAGFRLVEFALPFLKKWMRDNGHAPQDIRALLDRHGQRCIGGFEAPVEAFSDPARREANHALHVENAELLAQLGGGVLVVGTDGPGERSPHALDTIGHTLRELVERFPAAVSIALEFNWSPFVKSLRSASQAVRAAGHPRVGILFDPAHYHCTSTKLEHLTPPVVSQIIHVHMNDMPDKPGELSDCNSDRLLPGRGALPLRDMIERLERHGYRGAYSIEMFNQALWSVPAAEAARQCWQSMSSL